MTVKSKSRREKDAKARAANGGKTVTGRMNREKTSRAWYELKMVHCRSQAYIEQLAHRMTQYQNPLVLAKIVKNNQADRFNFLQTQMQQAAGPVAIEFNELWDSHKDIKKLCLSITELDQAMTIFNRYQQFDMDFFNKFQPIITELNEIFNTALKQLLDSQAKIQEDIANDARAKMLDPTIVSDVNYAPVPDSVAMPAAIEDLNKDSGVEVIENGAFEQAKVPQTEKEALKFGRGGDTAPAGTAPELAALQNAAASSANQANGETKFSTPTDELGLASGEPATEFAVSAATWPNNDGGESVLGEAEFKETVEAEVVKYETVGGDAPTGEQPIEVVEYTTGFGGTNATQ